MQIVPKILTVKAQSWGKSAEGVVVTSVGLVHSTGWSNPELSLVYPFIEPADGIQDLDFYAEPPDPRKRRAPIELPIQARELTIHCDVANYWGKGKPLKGVRVHSRTNSVEAPVEESEHAIAGEDLAVVPWPFPWEVEKLAGGDLPFPYGHLGGEQLLQIVNTVLVGKYLRVYHTGDMLTEDFRRDRANIELGKISERIVSAWIG